MITTEQLKNIFETTYDRKAWLSLLRDMFGMQKVLLKPQPIETKAVDKNWKATAEELGSFETAEGQLIGVYEVSISEHVNLSRNKVGLRTLLQPIYRNDVDAAFIVFNQGKCWRFSYVSEVTIRNKQTGKREKRATDPKRYTYLFGEGVLARTAAESFSELGQQYTLFGGRVKLADIQEAFSVENLTKDFYRNLSDWYFRALKEVDFPDDADRVVNPKPNSEEREKERLTRNATGTIRLITRLMFVWFLKQKKLVPNELFEKREVDKLINYKDKTGSTYYKAILQNLFFATLNTEMGDGNRKFVDRQLGVQGYYRYRRFFKDAERFLELTADIPFLNGGLFENLDKNVGLDNPLRIDCFSNQKNNEDRLTFPDSLFFESETIDLSKDYGDLKRKKSEVSGLIDILQRYNFTVEESTPLEIEVALDPELLGKVFENLLASYNPETETTARKMTGSFYTPREIVDFMVDESLKYYLLNTLPGRDEDITQLLSYTTEPHHFNDKESEKIVAALNQARILDPACGSGAFPMGVLHKMVHILNKLDRDNKLWRELQLKKALEETASTFINDTKEERDKRLLDISHAFDNNSDDYGRKLFLIENCIYGIDIQPIAVQISKLRFFISLIADQIIDRNKRKDNFGVRPMPNLETKFVAANTLIQIPKQLTLRNRKIEDLEKRLADIRHRHFSARTTKTKLKYREEDKETRTQIGELLKDSGWDTSTATQVSNWNPYDHNSSATFFDAEWMFGFQDGFDIIIGNPPYVNMQRSANSAQLKKLGYKTYEATGDIYSLFYECGNKLLRRGGVVCYITSNKWINASYGKSTRRYFTEQTNPLILIDFAKVRIFDTATVFVNILLFAKGKNEGRLRACTIVGSKLPDGELRDYFQQRSFQLPSLGEAVWKVNDEAAQMLDSRIEEKGTKLEHWKGITFYRGITTGFNDAFHIPKEDRDRLIRINKKNSEIIKPLLRGKDIKRWKYTYEDWYIIFTKQGVDINRYPEVLEYLKDYYVDLVPKKTGNETIGRKPGSYKWYEIQDNTAYYQDFELPKIVWIEISDRANFAYDETGKFLTNSAYFMTGEGLKYILAVLNSRVADYYFFPRTATIAGGRKRYTKQYVEMVPVPQIGKKEQEPFIKVVDYILYLKDQEDQSARIAASYFESILDLLVFELYFEDIIVNAGLSISAAVKELPTLKELKGLDGLLLMHKKLYSPKHHIRNAVFGLESVAELKDITSVYTIGKTHEEASHEN